MAAQPRQRRHRWLLAIPRRCTPLTAGLILPVVLAVGVMAGRSPATPAQPSIHPHPTRQPGTTQVIAGHIPLALNPVVPVLRARSSHRHISQAPSMTAGRRAPDSHRLSQQAASRYRNSMSQGQCDQRRQSYTPGRVYAKARGDSQPGGPPAAAPPGRTIRPPVIHISHASPPGRGRMRGIPQTQRQAG
jgi:hypothetical protein